MLLFRRCLILGGVLSLLDICCVLLGVRCLLVVGYCSLVVACCWLVVLLFLFAEVCRCVAGVLVLVAWRC